MLPAAVSAGSVPAQPTSTGLPVQHCSITLCSEYFLVCPTVTPVSRSALQCRPVRTVTSFLIATACKKLFLISLPPLYLYSLTLYHTVTPPSALTAYEFFSPIFFSGYFDKKIAIQISGSEQMCSYCSALRALAGGYQQARSSSYAVATVLSQASRREDVWGQWRCLRKLDTGQSCAVTFPSLLSVNRPPCGSQIGCDAVPVPASTQSCVVSLGSLLH
jgi:hypothetical protein